MSSSPRVEIQAFIDMPPPDSSRTPSVRSSLPLKSFACEMTDRPGMVTWPGDLRAGMVSDLLSWAVNPFAAQAAAASEPLPSGMDAVGLTLGRTVHGAVTSDDWFIDETGQSVKTGPLGRFSLSVESTRSEIRLLQPLARVALEV